jgi:Icc-related predicted phosphoesterase
MKIRILSDLHLEGSHAPPIANESGAELLILAGDICTHKSMTKGSAKVFFEDCAGKFKHVVWVMGNHELYGWENPNDKIYIQFFRDAVAHLENVYILENEIVTLEGVRIAGATTWTDFLNGELVPYAKQMMNDYRWGLKADVVYDWHKESVEFLLNSKADVIVTHHAPHVGSVHAKWKKFGGETNHLFYSNLRHVIDAVQPKYWFHGHMHDSTEYTLGNTTVVCNPKGYGNENRSFELIKELDV